MPAGPGMKIKTETPMVKKAREGVMEFLLVGGARRGMQAGAAWRECSLGVEGVGPGPIRSGWSGSPEADGTGAGAAEHIAVETARA